MKSQKKQILEALQQGWHLSKLQILDKIGCWNSGEAIRRLRNEGYPIKTEMKYNFTTKKRFAVYSLENEKRD
jgi:hypothetical protein